MSSRGRCHPVALTQSGAHPPVDTGPILESACWTAGQHPWRGEGVADVIVGGGAGEHHPDDVAVRLDQGTSGVPRPNHRLDLVDVAHGQALAVDVPALGFEGGHDPGRHGPERPPAWIAEDGGLDPPAHLVGVEGERWLVQPGHPEHGQVVVGVERQDRGGVQGGAYLNHRMGNAGDHMGIGHHHIGIDHEPRTLLDLATAVADDLDGGRSGSGDGLLELGIPQHRNRSGRCRSQLGEDGRETLGRKETLDPREDRGRGRKHVV